MVPPWGTGWIIKLGDAIHSTPLDEKSEYVVSTAKRGLRRIIHKNEMTKSAFASDELLERASPEHVACFRSQVDEFKKIKKRSRYSNILSKLGFEEVSVTINDYSDWKGRTPIPITDRPSLTATPKPPILQLSAFIDSQGNCVVHLADRRSDYSVLQSPVPSLADQLDSLGGQLEQLPPMIQNTKKYIVATPASGSEPSASGVATKGNSAASISINVRARSTRVCADTPLSVLEDKRLPFGLEIKGLKSVLGSDRIPLGTECAMHLKKPSSEAQVFDTDGTLVRFKRLFYSATEETMVFYTDGGSPIRSIECKRAVMAAPSELGLKDLLESFASAGISTQMGAGPECRDRVAAARAPSKRQESKVNPPSRKDAGTPAVPLQKTPPKADTSVVDLEPKSVSSNQQVSQLTDLEKEACAKLETAARARYAQDFVVWDNRFHEEVQADQVAKLFKRFAEEFDSRTFGVTKEAELRVVHHDFAKRLMQFISQYEKVKCEGDGISVTIDDEAKCVAPKLSNYWIPGRINVKVMDEACWSKSRYYDEECKEFYEKVSEEGNARKGTYALTIVNKNRGSSASYPTSGYAPLESAKRWLLINSPKWTRRRT